jgi:hypothetical protein
VVLRWIGGISVTGKIVFEGFQEVGKATGLIARTQTFLSRELAASTLLINRSVDVAFKKTAITGQSFCHTRNTQILRSDKIALRLKIEWAELAGQLRTRCAELCNTAMAKMMTNRLGF